jgi:molybdate transport system regulatory protein
MQTSARNHFSGRVKELVNGPVSTEVTITVGVGGDVVATISTRSADALALAVGKPVQALIKASSVLVVVD